MRARLLNYQLVVAVLVLAVPAFGGDADSEQEAAEGDAAPAAEQESQPSDEEVETITVTGSRLPEGDPTAVVYSLTADDFQAGACRAWRS